MINQVSFKELLVVLIGLSFILATARGFAYPAKESINQPPEALALPLSSLFKYTQREVLPQSGTQSDRQKNCYHFYVSRNMSSLLADATKMLRQVHDKRERDWILTFIYRIKSLAEHLRLHPDSQNYEECMSVDDDNKKKTSILSESLKIPQPELYFVDDMMPSQNQKRSVTDSEAKNEQATANQEDQKATDQKPQDNHQTQEQTSTDVKDQSMPNEPTHQETANLNSVAESTSESVSLKKDVDEQHPPETVPTAAGTVNSELTPNLDLQQDMGPSLPEEEDWMIGKGGDDSAIILSSPEPDCLTKVKCHEVMKRMEMEVEARNRGTETELERQLHARRRKDAEAERQYQELLKERIRKALLEEMAPELKKFRTVGGTEDDLIDLWKQSEIEVAKDEEKRRRENDFDYEEDGAAAGDLSNIDRSHPNYRTVAPSNDQVGNYKKTSDEMPYDNNDVLVQQLYDAARDAEPQYRATRSLDPQDEYLIISTHIPY